ncbi:MAG TPA: SRPBCC family protein, partial [Micromonosporaceae bacterium]|nr:SRPBCC family protein [Micromonosporaceae bacterium]
METNVDADVVTGVVAEVEMVVDLPIDQVWGLVTEVGRIGEWSPECVYAAWRPGSGDGPYAGARFDARNEYPGGYTSAVECVVTEAVRPSVFEWVVLDDDLDVARPGSIWRYELEPDPQGHGTRVRHRFTHGPGHTGLREGVASKPDRAQATLDHRLAQLKSNMTAT